MSEVLTSGHATSQLVKMSLNEFMMKPGPSNGGLTPADYLSRLQKFNKDRTFLEYQQVINVPLLAPQTVTLVDGFQPLGQSFMGESGGCFYVVNILSGPSINSRVDFYLSPSSLTGRAYRQWSQIFPYEIEGLAVNADQNRLAVMQK